MDIAGCINHVLQKEINALKSLKEQINIASLLELVNRITELDGKIVLSGLGKSGNIARKIAASLCSIGVQAVFMHAAEAMHGDLGLVKNTDIVIMFSNSGEGIELTYIIKHCKRAGIPTVGISSNPSSYLILNSDIKILLPVVNEASDLPIPTTSTIMMLALGDILTIILQRARSLTKDEYFSYHPGGKIGVDGLKMKDRMIRIPELPVIQDCESPFNALKKIVAIGYGCLVDEKGQMIGLILAEHLDYNTDLKSIVSNNYEVVSEEAYVSSLPKERYNVVLSDECPVGVLLT